jgi:hypothetical protein
LVRALVAGAFALGQGTGSLAGSSRRHVYTLRTGDVVLAPRAAVRCEASGEGGSPDLFCERTPHGRYQVQFFSDEILVWNNPDKPAFAARWAP